MSDISLMKKAHSTLFLAVVLTLSLGLNSCKKEESKSSNLPDFTGCRVTKIIGDGLEIHSSYNASGKLSKREYFMRGSSTPEDVYTYTYSGSKVEFSNLTGREKGVYTLNSSGNATNLVVTNFNGQDPNQATSTSTTTFKYNADGYLVEQISNFSSASGNSQSTYSYIWSDGNLVMETIVYNSGNTYSNTFEYYTDKSNSLNYVFVEDEFTGKDSKNLLKLIKDTGSGALKTKFSYEFDSSGRVKKFTSEDEDGESSTSEVEMTCP